KSLDYVDENQKFGWPWPRDFWVLMLKYLQSAGARCIVIDALFNNRSSYGPGDDKRMGQSIDSSKVPIVIATMIDESGKLSRFAPPTSQPVNFGVTTAPGGGVVKEYAPSSYGRPSLALAALNAIGIAPPPWASHRFWLHWYGPHEASRGAHTFKYITSAA